MDIKEIKEIFKDNGQRFTKAREEMISIFLKNKNEHFTIEEVINKLQAVDENNVATTYNNLNTFVELSIVREFSFNHKKHFELMQEMHGHFICEKCGKIFNVQIPGLACLSMEIDRKYGALVKSNTIDFNGYCADCRDKND